MGKFDGFLIHSDLDGTFAVGKNIFKENIDAIKYFTENGGKFAFCTGRPTGYLRDINMLDIINAPVCILNGAVVYDYSTEKVLFEKRLEFTVMEFINSITEFSEKVTTVRCYYNHFGVSFLGKFSDKIPEEELGIFPIKTVCYFDNGQDADEFRALVSNLPLFKDTLVTKSSPVLVEFNNINATKGTALQFSKNYLGNIHTSVGIGDYDNDIELLKGADFKVAVANAIPKLKELADVIVKPVQELALADLINIIESKTISL